MKIYTISSRGCQRNHKPQNLTLSFSFFFFWFLSLFSTTGSWTQDLANAEHMCFNCPDRTAERATCAIRLSEIMDRKELKLPLGISHWEKRKSGGVVSVRRGVCSPGQDFTWFWHCQTILKDRLELTTTSRPGLLSYACLFPSIEIRILWQYPKDRLGDHWFPLFDLLPNAIFSKFTFSAFHHCLSL